MDSTVTEEWRTVAAHPHVEVSNLGNVRNVWRNRVIARKIWVHETGYFMVSVALGERRSKQRRVHILVAEAFIGPKPQGMDVNHKDGDKLNNRVENLEYVTRSENLKHAFRLGLATSPFTNFQGSAHPGALITENDVRDIRSSYAGGESRKSIAARYSLSYYTVWDITAGRSWSHVY